MNTLLVQLISAQSLPTPPAEEHLRQLSEQLWRDRQNEQAARLAQVEIEELARCYRGLAAESALRPNLLRALAADGTPPALHAYADLFVEDPPQRAEDAAIACVPLMQRPSRQMAALFPRLLDALQRPATAVLVLDVANHLTRRGLLDEHPARRRVSDLVLLLGGLVEGLRKLEERPPAARSTEAQTQINDSVALIVALCESLAQIGDLAAVGKLFQVLSLGHRRLRVVAAHALARLGEPAGASALAELAAEPVVRPLALACLEQLGSLERVDPQYRSPAARAEGDLAQWLAHPTRFGLPPSEMELIDSTRQPWPGRSQPVECFLFHYEYQLPQGEFSGIGIAGPVTHSLLADLEDFTPEEIYALYAGWSAEHEEISDTLPGQLNDEQRAAWDRWRNELEDEGYQDLQLLKLGHFFGEDLFVAEARRQGQSGVLIVEDSQPHWQPIPQGLRAIGPAEIYWLFIGQRMLRAFQRR